MRKYRVIVEVDAWADSPEEAATSVSNMLSGRERKIRPTLTCMDDGAKHKVVPDGVGGYTRAS
jgi:hypothetical protein